MIFKIGTKGFARIIAVFWTSFICILVLATIRSPYDLPFSLKSSFVNFFPEGWGFFTKNPREELYDFYLKTKEDGSFASQIKSCTDKEYLFGFSRDCRMKSAELTYLIHQVGDSLWRNGYQGNNRVSFHTEEIDQVIQNQFNAPTIFGEYYLVKEERLPWAWSKNHRKIIPKFQYVKVLIK